VHLAEYDVFVHYCQTLSLRLASKLAMFSFFLDESGPHMDASNAVVGGYLATVQNWKQFQKEWRKLLKKSKVEVSPSSGYGKLLR